jgi:para-nitrobenzyl esterase
MMGATSFPLYDRTKFAKKGVVLVSIAYRLGPFGFLAHPQLSAESGGNGFASRTEKGRDLDPI